MKKRHITPLDQSKSNMLVKSSTNFLTISQRIQLQSQSAQRANLQTHSPKKEVYSSFKDLTPRTLDYDLKTSCEVIGQSPSPLIGTPEETKNPIEQLKTIFSTTEHINREINAPMESEQRKTLSGPTWPIGNSYQTKTDFNNQTAIMKLIK